LNRGLRWRLERLLQVESSQKPLIYSEVYRGAHVGDATYWLQLFLSAGIATLGLVLNSPAVIIGAMLISPLMGPIMSMGLALAVGDLYLGIRSLISLLISTLASVALAAALVWILPFHSANSEILARTAPNLLDLAIAILSGLAGSILLVRRRSEEGATALPGVAIAVALMPPLCVVGFGVGSSFNPPIITGAALLFLTNIVAIVASAFLIFLVIGMNTPEVRLQIDQSLEERGKSDRLYRLLVEHTHGVFGNIGKLRWRVLMLLLLLGALFLPLRSALLRVKDETVARSAVQSALAQMVPAQSVVAQQVQYSTNGINISVFSTAPVANLRVRQAEEFVRSRSGLRTVIDVEEVASRKDLSELASRMTAPALPATPTPPPPSLQQLSQKLEALLSERMAKALPTDTPISSYQLQIGQGGKLNLLLSYTGREVIDPLSLAVLQQSLQQSLGLPDLTVLAQRVKPAPVNLRSKNQRRLPHPKRQAAAAPR
jgi:uncharacterized hydrophobic protein (TIGR00271 family)